MPRRSPFLCQAERDALRVVTRPCPDDSPGLRRLAFAMVAGLHGRTLPQSALRPIFGPKAPVVPLHRRPRPLPAAQGDDAA